VKFKKYIEDNEKYIFSNVYENKISSFKNYLNEKVSSADLNRIFSNRNIIVGVEFEFYAPKIAETIISKEGRTISGYGLDRLSSDYKNFIDELDDWVRKVKKEDKEIPPPEIPYSLIELDDYLDNPVDFDNLGKKFDFSYYLENPRAQKQILRQLEPTEEMFEIDEDESDAFFVEVENQIKLNVPEIKEIRIGQSPSKNDGWWGLIDDPSVTLIHGGVEVISPPMPMPDFIKIVPKFLDFIKNNGNTDTKTGLHVSISLKDISLKPKMDIIKLLCFHDEELVYKHFKDRKGNEFAISVKEKLFKPDYKFQDLYKIMHTGKLEKNVIGGKFFGINFDKIENNYLEFRYMGSSGYETKWDSIKILVGNHAYNIKLACDENFKRQEYAKKLNRLINRHQNKYKEEYIYLLLFDYTLEWIDKFISNDSETQRIVKMLKNGESEISSAVSATTKTAIKSFFSLYYSPNELKKYIKNFYEDYLSGIKKEDVQNQIIQLHSDIRYFENEINRRYIKIKQKFK